MPKTMLKIMADGVEKAGQKQADSASTWLVFQPKTPKALKKN